MPKHSWRWLQTSNAYRLAVPASEVEPSLRSRRFTAGHFGRGGERLKQKGAEQTASQAAWEAMHQAAVGVFRRIPEPQPPVRTVQEQLAALGYG